MTKIIILDELTANKIAAGEVVERPSSVVKELLENAIDAGSTRIEIAIEEGGLKKIRVTDNGSGIPSEDLALAFLRHATSKITGPEDLTRINTMGFRGEALPSIAAVAQVTVTTKTLEEYSGSFLTIKGGKVEDSGDAGSPVGTSIVVANLFYNTPARRKFLKSAVTETGQVSDLVLRLALSHPEIAIKLISNGREILATPGNGSLFDTVVGVYGLEFARQLIPIEANTALFKVSGYLSKPQFSRATRSHQSFFVNQRYIKSQMLSQALAEGYHTLLTSGRHPAALITLQLDPALVDVNVHPTKMEVRFSNEKEISFLLANKVSNALKSQELIPGLVKLPDIAIENQAQRSETATALMEEVVEQVSLPLTSPKTYAAANTPASNIIGEERAAPSYQPKVPCEIPPSFSASEAVKQPAAPGQLIPPLVPLGQIDSTYIVAQGPDGMFLIDQHAAHERVIYETLMEEAAQRRGYRQELLIPITLELTHQEAQILIKHILLLTELGFKIEHFSGDSFLVRSFPQGVAKGLEKDFFQDLLAQLEETSSKLTTAKLKEKVLITAACKGAIKAGQKLSRQEIEALLESLARTENPYTCPHGRPTIIHLSQLELEKKFKRKL